MNIEKLEGTSPRLYTLVAPLVMRRSVIRQNNNYPFWTSCFHEWVVALDGGRVRGFMPVELSNNGVAKINNYYMAGDDTELLAAMLRTVLQYHGRDWLLRAVVHTRHAETFRSLGFQPVMEWKLYVKMERRMK